jgi:hypothetical protein
MMSFFSLKRNSCQLGLLTAPFLLLYPRQVLCALLVIPLKGSLGVPLQGIEDDTDASSVKKTFPIAEYEVR